MNRLVSLLLGLAAAAGALAGLASPAAAAPVQARASARLYTRVEGELVRAALEIRIQPGWHLYHTELGPPDAVGMAFSGSLSGEGIDWGPVVLPEPHRLEQPGIGKDGRDTWILGHKGTIVAHALGRLAPGAPAPAKIEAKLRGLTCQDDGSCIPYNETVASLGAGSDPLFADFPLDESDLSGSDAETGSTGAASAGTETGSTDAGAEPGGTSSSGRVDYEGWTWSRDFEARESEVSRGLGMWLLLAFVAGMILNVMPCVLPVISIKVLSFVQQAGEDRRRIFALGLAFAAGIVVVFLVLAGLAVGAGLSWGEQFSSETFLIVMIGIVFAFGLSLFGLFELGVPQAVGGLVGMRREGLVDAFLKGMLATVLATPCSGPFLGSTLTWTLAQPAATVFLVFVLLGVGMAFPYVVLTANPAFLKVIPKPGPWMETFKQAMGFVLMVTVVYLMISLKQDKLLFTVAFLLFVALGCWWWGRFATFDQSKAKRWVTLLVALAIPLAGAKVSFGWFQGLFEEQSDSIAWIDFEPDLFEQYLDEGRNVLVDFTADWCPNCKYNENFVLDTEEVRGRMADKHVVPMKADITHGDLPKTKVIKSLMAELGAVSIPFLAVFPADDPSRPYTRKDVVKVATMVEIFDALPDAPPRPRLRLP